MIELRDNDTNSVLGTITEKDLAFLKDHLEEESLEDQDYYINKETIDVLENAGADKKLVDILRRALGSREEMEVTWTT